MVVIKKIIYSIGRYMGRNYPKIWISFRYFLRFHKRINWQRPRTLNEKILYLSMMTDTTRWSDLADKYKVREYVKKKGLEDILVPLVGHWERPEDIEWDKLPNKFVLKCNHGCAYNILCHDKNTFKKEDAIKKIRKWMKEDFGAFNIETHYSKIKPHIICEEYLGNCIIDYKFFCFNGEPKYIYISSDLVHDRQARIGFFYLDGTKMPLIRDDYAPMDIEKLPPFFEDMKRAADILCKDFTFVRVDFFIANGTYYFAELTFTPSGGMMPFNPDKYDLEWGGQLNIPKLKINKSQEEYDN